MGLKRLLTKPYEATTPKFLKNIQRNTLVGGMMAGDDFNTAAGTGFTQAADPFKLVLKGEKYSLPKHGETNREMWDRKAKEKKRKERAERFKQAGFKKGGQVKVATKPSGTVKHSSKAVTCCRGMGAATRGGKFSRNG